MPITTAAAAITRGLPSTPSSRAAKSPNVAGRKAKLRMVQATAETPAEM